MLPCTANDFGNMALCRLNRLIEVESHIDQGDVVITIQNQGERFKSEEGIPVIVDCQAWRSVSQYNESWADTWHDGHWLVVIGIDENNVTLEDPYILGDRGIMSREEFMARWHNVRGLDETDTGKQIHMGIAIRGERPYSTSGFRHID